MQMFMKTKKGLIVLILGLFSLVNQAHALSCGDVIMTDTIMTEDLYCTGTGPSGLYAIEFGNDNITLDMNGHTITGAGGVFSNVILGLEFRNKIIIENGSIVDSSVAIAVLNSENIHLQNMTFYNIHPYGIYSENSKEVLIEDNDFYYSHTGILIRSNSTFDSHSKVLNNQFYKNSTSVELHKSSKNTIAGNFVWKSTNNGISLNESNDNRIIKNTIMDTANTALSLTNSSENTISSNKLDSSYTGLAILANSDSCYGCDSKYNSFNYNYSLNSKIGIDLGGLPGPGVVSYNTLKGNKIYDNETGIYFHTDALYNTTSNGFQGTAMPIIDEGTGNTY